MPASTASSSHIASTLRRILLGIFFLGVFASGIELVLLEHTEWFWQVTPLAALALAVVMATMAAVRPARASLRAFQGLMVLFVVLAGIGLYLHYHGNVEFELEMYPSLGGFELVWKTMTGATPVLAPGLMAHLALVGLAYTYRHPALARERPPDLSGGT